MLRVFANEVINRKSQRKDQSRKLWLRLRLLVIGAWRTSASQSAILSGVAMAGAACFLASVPFGGRVPGAAGAFEFAVVACGSFDPPVAVDGAGAGPGAVGLRSGGLASAALGSAAAAFFGVEHLAAAASCRIAARAFAPT